MVDTFNIFILLNRPLFRNVGHANFLSLVYKRGASLESMEYSNEFCAGHAVLRFIICKTADDSGLIMILEVEGVPAVIVVHEILPFVDHSLQLCEGPCAGGELALGAIVEHHAWF